MSAALRALLAVAVLVAAGDGFLLWGRTVLDPVDAASARARFLVPAASPAGQGPRPPAGLYRYRTSGRETVDRFAVERAYPHETVRVVSDLGGCRWRETVPLFDQHTETYDFCSGGGDAREVAYATRLVYFFVPGVQRFACDPPGRRLLTGARPGTVLRWRCTAGGSSSDNTTTFVGVETVGGGPSDRAGGNLDRRRRPRPVARRRRAGLARAPPGPPGGGHQLRRPHQLRRAGQLRAGLAHAGALSGAACRTTPFARRGRPLTPISTSVEFIAR